MTIYLKQSTASQEVLLGPFLDDTDGKTAETALTINNTDIKVWKTGATTLANKNSGGATHISNGNYYAVLDATDTNTLGSLELIVQVSGALPVRRECVVLTANIYDSLIGGTDLFDVSVTQWTGTNVASPDTAGYPKVTLKSGTGTGEVSLSSGTVQPTPIRSGTAQAGASSTITLDASASATDNLYNTNLVYISSGTGAGQTRTIQSYVGSTKVATIHPNWTTNPDNTSVFIIIPNGSVNIMTWRGSTPNQLQSGRVDGYVGAMAADTLTASAVATDAVTEIQSGLATSSALSTVAGYIDTEVAAIKAVTDLLPNGGALTSLATAANLATLTGYVDTEVAAIKAKTDNLPAAPAATGDIPTANQNADALLDRAAGVETGLTVRQWLRIAAAALFGKASGLETTTAVYRDFGDSKDRITATVDADGNRTAVTTDAT